MNVRDGTLIQRDNPLNMFDTINPIATSIGEGIRRVTILRDSCGDDWKQCVGDE